MSIFTGITKVALKNDKIVIAILFSFDCPPSKIISKKSNRQVCESFKFLGSKMPHYLKIQTITITHFSMSVIRLQFQKNLKVQSCKLKKH